MKAEKGVDFFDKQFFVSQLLENKTPREIWDVPEERMDQIYQFACDLYDEKKYNDASDVFFLLTTLDPENISFWKGLGFSSQQKSDFYTAAFSYACAIRLQPREAELYPYYLRVLCEMGQRERALSALEEMLHGDFDHSPQEIQALRSQGITVLYPGEGI